MNELVSIIILNYNGKRFLKDCLDSLLAQTYPEFEIILFDNASVDGSVEFVQSTFTDPRIKIIVSDENLGFAGGNNEALKHCTSDLIVLLNNDTRTEKDWLEHLVRAMQSRNTIASSFVITKGVPGKYYETNGSVSYLMYNIMNVFPDIEDEFYPNGCSLIFRKSEIGEPFDSDYLYYGEDVYLGLKARFKRMNIRFVKRSVVHHFGSGTSTKNSKRSFYIERNKFLNLYLFFSPLFIIRLLPYITLNHTLRTVISLFSPKISFAGTLKAYLWFYLNIPLIIKKRKELQKSFKIHEKEIIGLISSKIFNDGSAITRMVNGVSYLYSRLVGIKPVEYYLRRRIKS
jgi:hypothetical protein